VTQQPEWIDALRNESYRGGAFAWLLLALLGALNLGRGSIHLFAEDGGAGRIAGIDLAQGGEVIVMLFAAMGLTQILLGIVDLGVALRFRALVPVVLLFHGVQQIGVVWIVWFYKPLSVPAPGKYGAVVLLPLVALAFWDGVRRRKQPGAAVARTAEAG
jgi:hypothetical protein